MLTKTTKLENHALNQAFEPFFLNKAYRRKTYFRRVQNYVLNTYFIMVARSKTLKFCKFLVISTKKAPR